MWMYFLHVCVSIKIHCLLNTGLLPTCRNMCTHTRHTPHAHAHTRTHTDTTLLHKLWCLTCRCISLKGQERGTWVPTLRGALWARQQAHACPHHAASTRTRPALDLAPAAHSSSFQLPSEAEAVALRWLGGGKNEWVVKPQNVQQGSVAVGILQLPCRYT